MTEHTPRVVRKDVTGSTLLLPLFPKLDARPYLPMNTPPTLGCHDIAIERCRQIASEGYDAAHDDDHTQGEIAVVAAELATAHAATSIKFPGPGIGIWVDREDVAKDPWGLLKKHPDTRRRLVIAGALIAAEIDRLDRLAAKQSTP